MNATDIAFPATGETTAKTSVARPANITAYAISVFTSALLLFLVQPLIAKQLLPRFGGAAGVWTACLMFFQVVLLLGYLYAHFSTRMLSCRAQGITHSLLLWLGLAVTWFPVGNSTPAGAAGHPVFGVIALLAGSVGIPYFVLSATSPLLQSWYATVERREVPYRLFALSNLGSLLALLAYPVIVEPSLELATQILVWRLAYLVFAVFGTTVALRAARSQSRETAPAAPAVHPAGGLSQKALWVVLAACPSALLLAITNNLCQVMAPVPLLWIAPLATYLITFIICFDHGPWLGRTACRILVPVSLMALIWVQARLDTPLMLAVSLYLGALFVIAMFCHGKLVELKPEGSEVTAFYLCISLGGAIGGLFVGLVAPAIFSDFFELAVAASVALVLCLRMLFGYRSNWFLATCGVSILLLLRVLTDSSGRAVEFKGRNFYGALAIKEDRGLRELLHGKVVHGNELLSEANLAAPEPTTYYGRKSGVGLALARAVGPQRVGAVGLGVGTVASYGRPGDEYRFYEINPMVEQLARSRFTYLSASRANVSVQLGDARLSLEKASDQNFDTLILDAFAGDAVPIHLLTREAFACYFRHVKPNGLMAVHVSNQYLNLAPLVASLAAGFGRQALRVTSPADLQRGVNSAIWVLVTTDTAFLQDIERRKLGNILVPGAVRAWTDQYSNVLAVLWR